VFDGVSISLAQTTGNVYVNPSYDANYSDIAGYAWRYSVSVVGTTATVTIKSVIYSAPAGSDVSGQYGLQTAANYVDGGDFGTATVSRSLLRATSYFNNNGLTGDDPTGGFGPST